MIDGLDISADAKSLLFRFSKATITAGQHVIKLGRKIIDLAIRRWGGLRWQWSGRSAAQPVDAIGSVAHYLAEHGWRTGQPTHFAVTPPTDEAARAKLLAPDILPSFSADEMRALGAVLPEVATQQAGPLALVLLENGDQAPTLIAGTQNFYAITRYNQSSYYALAVIELGQAVSKPRYCRVAIRNASAQAPSQNFM